MKMDTDNLTTLLLDIDYDKLLDCDLDDAADNFTDALMTAAKTAIPIHIISHKSNDKPWFDKELKSQTRKRDRLVYTAKKRNTLYDWQRWSPQGNLFTIMSQKLNIQHMQSKDANSSKP